MHAVERPTAVMELGSGVVEYRLERRDRPTILVFSGGHMRAGLVLGEDVYASLGCSVLAVSRPGYGRTPVRSGTTPAGFADVTADLCGRLGIDQIAATVGISAGGRTAVTMAARHPALVQRLILESATSFLPWPGRFTRLGAFVAFNSGVAPLTWFAVRALMRRSPKRGLAVMLGSLSRKPARDVLARLSDADRETLVELFCRMRSGHGFLNDLRKVPDVTTDVCQPTLVIATRDDGAVDFAHAEALATSIPNAELFACESDAHFIWFGSGYHLAAERIRTFLETSGE